MPSTFSTSSDGTSAQVQIGAVTALSVSATGAQVAAHPSASDSSLNLATTQFAASRTSANLVNLAFPSSDGGGRDIARAGWLPVINQQWGGAYHFTEITDAATGQMYKFEPATGNVQDDGLSSVSSASGTYYQTTGFKVAESATYDSIWLKLYKVGNPANNLTVRIYSDNGSGSPSATLGSAVTISPRLITSKTDGEWYRLSGFGVALTAGTQYHIVCSTLSAVDASSYYVLKTTASRKYPFGFQNSGTSVPAWTQTTTASVCFLVEPPISSALLQPSGRFDKRLIFGGLSSQPGQQRVLTQPLRNFYDGKSFTFLERLTSIGVSQIVADFAYGLDHDRIVVGTNASGYPFVTLYTSAGSTYTVTGTASVATGDQDIAVVARTFGDGADYLKLYVNGVAVGTSLTSQTFVLDPLMREVGNAYVGGGLPLAPTWTSTLAFTALPSALGWTWTGTGTEANCMSVSGGKLYQNASGYGASVGYYSKTTSFNNSTGWTISWKSRNTNSPNSALVSTSTSYSQSVAVNDGAKAIAVTISEYFIQTTDNGVNVSVTIQGDFKRHDHTFILQGRGSDYYLYVDGVLLIDGTGKLIYSSSLNSISFGDNNSAVGENADVIWSYIKYSNTGMNLPVPAQSASLSELAYWTGDQSALLPILWDNGSPISVKKMCGCEKNYIEYGKYGISKQGVRGVTTNPTTTSTSFVLMPEMEGFIYGSEIEIDFRSTCYNSSISTPLVAIVLDGALAIGGASGISIGSPGYFANFSNYGKISCSLGIHKSEGRWLTTGGTMTAYSNYRNFQVTAKV